MSENGLPSPVSRHEQRRMIAIYTIELAHHSARFLSTRAPRDAIRRFSPAPDDDLIFSIRLCASLHFRRRRRPSLMPTPPVNFSGRKTPMIDVFGGLGHALIPPPRPLRPYSTASPHDYARSEDMMALRCSPPSSHARRRAATGAPRPEHSARDDAFWRFHAMPYYVRSSRAPERLVER